MITRLFQLLFCKPSEDELRKADQIKKLFSNAEMAGYRIKVTRYGGIVREKIE